MNISTELIEEWFIRELIIQYDCNCAALLSTRVLVSIDLNCKYHSPYFQLEILETEVIKGGV